MNLLPDLVTTEPKTVDTFLGKMPAQIPQFKGGSPENRQLIEELINSNAGNPGMQIIEKGAASAKPIIESGINYLRPSQAGKAAEEFRQTLGSGTSTENINELGKRIQLGKQSALEEALTPKKEIYSQVGKEDILKVKPENLPEGNLPKMASMIEKDSQFDPNKINALSKALKNYRKSGDISSFLEKSEDIFNVSELPEKAIDKIEDALLMPTKRESSYLNESDVSEFYSKKGKLLELHNKFKKRPTLNNYDSLQSALKKELRIAQESSGDLSSSKVDALKKNISNLDKDKEVFTQMLPDKLKNLENEFRLKYKTNVVPYEEEEILNKLSNPKMVNEVTPNQITNLFGRPSEAVKKILTDIGPSGARNILYNALLKVPEGNAEGMAKTILDLKKTKGFDKIVSQDMEVWATNMLKRVKHSQIAKKGTMTAGGALGGYLALGPVGALAGATLANVPKGMELLSKYLKR